jgi:predicted metalloprotease
MRRGPARILFALLLVVTACTPSELSLHAETVGGARSQPDAPGPPGTDPDEVVDVALEDLATFWTERLPAVYGEELTPLRGGLVPYGPGTPVPQCGPTGLSYQDIAANALYCPDEDLIAWDRVGLIPDLHERFGPLTVGAIMAHEFAHAVQARAGVQGSPLMLEMQADCFAGAWAADASQRIDLFSTDGDALDLAIGGLLELRDVVGVSASDPNAHGSGFDRVSAFQDGFNSGGAVCGRYEDAPPPVVAIPFVSVNDLNQGGNLPLDRLMTPLLADLEAFFAQLVTTEGGRWDPVDGVVPVEPATALVTCGDQELTGDDLVLASFYCVPDDIIYLDSTGLIASLDRIGDFAVAAELARQYAFAAQAKLGLLDRFLATDVHADCVTGVYAAAEFSGVVPDQQLVLSPGDLDEIITAFLAFGGDAEAGAFERFGALRTGFTAGFDACASYLVD